MSLPSHPDEFSRALAQSWPGFMAYMFGPHGGPPSITTSESFSTDTDHITSPISEMADSSSSSLVNVPPTDTQLPSPTSGTSDEATHSFLQVSKPTTIREIKQHIHAIDLGAGGRAYACVFPGCTRLVGFQQRTHVISHIRSAHLQEMPYACTCGTLFARKPDAIRHVTTKNAGRRYKCSVCDDAFERKDFRDLHEAGCFAK